jgi:hypothetical protein
MHSRCATYMKVECISAYTEVSAEAAVSEYMGITISMCTF